MKLTTDRKALATALDRVKPMLPKGRDRAYPILQTCRLTADKDSLTIEVTDLDVHAVDACQDRLMPEPCGCDRITTRRLTAWHGPKAINWPVMAEGRVYSEH